MSALQRPLCLCVICFAIGLAIGLRFGAGAAQGVVAAMLIIVAAASARLVTSSDDRGGAAPILLIFLFLGLGLGVRDHLHLLADCRASIADGSALRVDGTLEASHFGANGEGRVALLPLRASNVVVDGRPVTGCSPVMRVRLPTASRQLPAGTRLTLTGEWHEVPPPPVPSSWPRDPRHLGWLRVDTIHLDASVGAATPVLALRGRSEAALRTLVPNHAELVEALLLGRRERLDPAVREKFARAGLSHLLAISGMHVGILTGILLVIGRITRLSRSAVTWATVILIGAYLLFIGAPPSAVRAGSMISLALWAMRLQRPFEPLGLMVAAAFVILFARPATLLEPGFQLSFGGVIGILVARRTILGRLPGSLRSVRGGQWLAESLVVSGAAFLATAPIVAWHFGLLAPVAVLANVPAVPLLGLAIIGILLGAVTTPLVPSVGGVFIAAATTMLDLLGRVADFAADIPFGHGWVTRPQAVTWVVAVLVCLFANWMARASRPPVRAVTATGALFASLLIAPLVSETAETVRSQVEIHFLDVGQGDAAAIRTPRGRWILIDAGPADERFDAGERRILPFLRAHGVQRLELLILTHPHRDHIGGVPALLRSVEIGSMVEPGYPYPSPLYLEILRTVEQRGVQWRAARSGRIVEVDGVELHFLWPDQAVIETATDANEISAVVQLRFGGFSALFTGDAYDSAEWELVKRHGERLRSQVLKAGHHGSYTSTSPELLDVAMPEVVVISAGRRNRFGHPSPEVMSELRRRGLRVARTDLDGTITIRVDTTRAMKWRIDEKH